MNIDRRTLLRAAGAAGAASMLQMGAASGRLASAPRPRPRFAGDPGSGRLFYGASTDQNLRAWERALGKRLSMHRTFHRAGERDSVVDAVKADLRMGRLPHASTKCPGSWEAVAAGSHDRWLKHLRWQLATVDRPVFLTFHHEPENDARRLGQSPADFVAMQTRIIELFARRAPKVTIVRVLQSWTLDPANPRARPQSWNVPAARVFGIDIYNPFSATQPTWVPFETKLSRARKLAGSRPIAVGEYGCRADPADPERATQWMRDAFRVARDGGVVSMSYFHSGVNSPGGPWHLDGGRGEVFRNRLSAPAVSRLGG